MLSIIILQLLCVLLLLFLLLNRGKSAGSTAEVQRENESLKNELHRQFITLGESQSQLFKTLGSEQQRLLEHILKTNRDLAQRTDQHLERLRESNEKKLDAMRQTVDEKLQNTLEKRLGESFNIVRKQLDAVHQGLGEMQNLAQGVGDLKRVLTGVKDRGTWGEVQLEGLLELVLTPEQYAKNVQIVPGERETVEFAIKLPGQAGQDQVWLPVDSKFPKEDYERLLQAQERADKKASEEATKALTRAVEKSAKDIEAKYIAPPHSSDFAILFLPTEGLFAEVLRQPGLIDRLQQNFRVVVAGPTTFSSILSSLRMGFRTLAIEKRSSEVWKILATVKNEFGKFGTVLEKVKNQVDSASRTLESTQVRSRAMERHLREVEVMPETLKQTENKKLEE